MLTCRKRKWGPKIPWHRQKETIYVQAAEPPPKNIIGKYGVGLLAYQEDINSTQIEVVIERK